MVVRRDVNVEAIGKMAELPPDLSPLQIGARGRIDGNEFTLIGRVRLAYDGGSWNEWCALFADDHWGWVAEAQGFFMVSVEIAVPPDFPPTEELRLNQVCRINKETFRVTDRKETVCLGSEGELTFAAPAGRQALSVDLTGAKAQFACAEFSESGTRLFTGRYARFDDLEFTNLRPVPGWSEDAPVTRGATSAMNCPECGAAVELRAAGASMSAACGSCGSILDTATPELKLIRQASESNRFQPAIPLGRRGKLFGVEYEVIGFQYVKDEYSGWSEFLLFNPWQGFVWLVTYEGHWSFVRRLFEQPRVTERDIFSSAPHAHFQGEAYRIFADSQVSTEYVLGEFYWKVAIGHPAHVTDFVHPPKILSRETYPNLEEETWSQGEYIEPEVIQLAFHLETPPREPEGVYLNQPNPHAEQARQLKWLVPLLACLMLIIQTTSANRAANQQVFHGEYKFRAGATNPVAVTAPFEIPGGRQAVAFTLQAPVQNNWLEVGVDLVKADTQQAVSSFEQGVEYYYGNDDGFWSEGSQAKRHILPGVAPGKYYLTIDASADPAVREMPFSLIVVRDVTVWSNFWIGLGVLLVYPIYRWLRAATFENARWLDSDYPPYGSSSDDDSSDDDE